MSAPDPEITLFTTEQLVAELQRRHEDGGIIYLASNPSLGSPSCMAYWGCEFRLYGCVKFLSQQVIKMMHGMSADVKRTDELKEGFLTDEPDNEEHDG